MACTFIPGMAVLEVTMSEPTDCLKCGGCGQVADNEDEEPWTEWERFASRFGPVRMGMVRPKPCPVCSGGNDDCP